MRIFTAVRHSLDPSQFYGGLWGAQFYPALRALGHEIVESATDLLPASRFMEISEKFTHEQIETRARITQSILDEIKAAHRQSPLSACLFYFYNSHFDPAGFDDIRALGIPTINFYCNSIHQFPLVRTIASRVDFSWHPERDAHAAYLAAGARPVHVQMGADPNLCHAVENARRAARACFVGMRYADRDVQLAQVVRSGVPVDIYGSGWGTAQDSPRLPETQTDGNSRLINYARVIAENIRSSGMFGGVVRTMRQARHRSNSRTALEVCRPAAKGRAGALAEVFGAYEVVLNLSNVWSDARPGSTLVPHVRMRDFEAPMCRTCYLTGHTDEIGEFYEIGREIETYRSPDELGDKTQFLLSHPDAAEKMREAGWQRARRDHTWQRRFEELFRKTGLT